MTRLKVNEQILRDKIAAVGGRIAAAEVVVAKLAGEPDAWLVSFAARILEARDSLAAHLAGSGVPYEPFCDLRDVAAALR